LQLYKRCRTERWLLTRLAQLNFNNLRVVTKLEHALLSVQFFDP